MELALLRITAAGIATFIIGYIWYHPKLFGGIWIRLSGLSPELVERAHKRKHFDSILSLAVSVIAAYVMNYIFVLSGIEDASSAIRLALLIWIGFAVPVLSGIVLWEQKPLSLYLINIFYWLIALLAMSAILTV
ncbi:MAG TPA: DUF1761 domain-containing protein [Candidatus Paceibacterota bacterium]